MTFWAAGATVVGAVGGAVISSQGNKKAAGKAAQGAQAAIDQSNYQFNTIRSDTAPYRAIGTQALNALGSIYGYQPANQFYGNELPSDARRYQAPGVNTTNVPGGSLNIGGTLAASGKYGGIGKLLDPVGSLFGNKHGDEKRNLQAFTSENDIYDVGDGMLSLADGTQFKKSQLQDVAGAWYGANYAPDGNQEDWQQRYAGLITAPTQPQPAQLGQTGQPAAPTNALTSPDYSAFFKSPDYTFRRDEGLKGIERTAASRGGAFSGNALKALNEFNSNLAGGEFGNYFNRQAALAGIGQTATAQTNNAGLVTSSMNSNALRDQGDARASGVAGSANAWGSALSELGQGAGYYFGNRNSDPSGIGYFKPTVRRV